MEILKNYITHLKKSDSIYLGIFPEKADTEEMFDLSLKLMKELSFKKKDDVIKDFPHFEDFFRDTYILDQFIENLYNYWRNFERFFVFYSNGAYGQSGEEKPYRTFNETVESLDHVVRSAYRDIRENITGEHPKIYRQVAAGCQIGLIANDIDAEIPKDYDSLKNISIIRQVYMSPPLILDPPTNKRDGFFQKVDENPIKGIEFNEKEWICYPAKVFDTIILVYFNTEFIGLGSSLANLFDLASEEDLKKGIDAIYAYGVPKENLEKYGSPPTVFYDDTKNGILVGAVPRGDFFGYFGYLKKMILTLHNSISIKKGRLPSHGAMVKITMKNGKSANVLIWGDSGAGKSETLEALRVLGDKYIRDMRIIFDDMGSLEIGKDGSIKAYGTETGAFVRLDDLQPGFAFGNMDRAIIHSPHKINARAIIPITTQEEVARGHPIDFLLYANNYEEIDRDTPILERFETVEEALEVFRKSARMAKGTTSEKGLTHSFFANPFGPHQYRDEYEELAQKYFRQIFNSKTFVGQIRTRLGIPGFETEGPQAAAKELFGAISKM